MSDVFAILFFATCLAVGLELAFEAVCLVMRLMRWLASRPSGRHLAQGWRIDGRAVEMTSPGRDQI